MMRRRDSGHVRIYEYSNDGWIQLGRHRRRVGGDQSGSSVSVSSDGNRIAIGAQIMVRTDEIQDMFAYTNIVVLMDSIR
jgi:hypothetical protein